MRQHKGTVGIETVKGMLRIRLPRPIFGGIQKYICTGLSDTTENRRRVTAKAWEIERDLISGYFDPSLGRYQFKARYEPPRQALSLTDIWDRYCDFKRTQWAETTIKLHVRRMTNHIQSLPFQKLTDADDILIHLVKSCSPDTARRVLVEIKACCNWAIKSRLISSNPFADIKFKTPKIKPLIDPFDQAETIAIIEAFELTHYGNLVKFLFMTGCRSSEAFGLTWQNVTPEFILFSQAIVTGIKKGTKTGIARRFPCNDALRSLMNSMRSQVGSSDLVFARPSGRPLNSNDFINNYWKGRSGRSGIVSRLVDQGKVYRYRPQYNTRHTFITNCINNGVPIPTVADWVGNSPEIIFKHYCGISNQPVPTIY